MAEETVLKCKCPNKDCGVTLKLPGSYREGIHQISCPKCKTKFRIGKPAAMDKAKPVEQHLAETKPSEPSNPAPKPVVPVNPAPKPVAPVPPKPQPARPVKPTPKVLDNSAEEPRDLNMEVKTDEEVLVVCPFCGKTTPFVPPKLGRLTLTCPRCKGRMYLLVKNPTTQVDGAKYPHRGKLQMASFAFFKKDFTLKMGINTIGRADKDLPSDIQIKDDYMSRQSAELEVKINERGGFLFYFRVRSATNPVLVNHVEVLPGSEVLLNYGDIITMGKTNLTFLQDK